MSAYYNENDPYAAQWLRNLISKNLIAPGDVDERSITEVRSDDLNGYTQCHFFAGIGVWSYALRRAGWEDSRAVWTGSCPCQPFSIAGQGRSTDDERHLWPAWFELIAARRPETIFGEQVASHQVVGKAEADASVVWFDVVQAHLEIARYATAAVDLPAASVGAPHVRQRLWFVAERLADSEHKRRQGRVSGRADSSRQVIHGRAGCDSTTDFAGACNGFWSTADWIGCKDDKYRPVEPGSCPLANGSTGRVGRLRAYGNAIVAPVATTFIMAYLEAQR